MDEFDQYEAFARLIEQDQTVEDVANRFGVTDRLVKQRLALAGLLPDLKAVIQAEKFHSAETRVLALASPDQQVEWLAMYNLEFRSQKVVSAQRRRGIERF